MVWKYVDNIIIDTWIKKPIGSHITGTNLHLGQLNIYTFANGGWMKGTSAPNFHKCMHSKETEQVISEHIEWDDGNMGQIISCWSRLIRGVEEQRGRAEDVSLVSCCGEDAEGIWI
jgi:hypothetical protein